MPSCLTPFLLLMLIVGCAGSGGSKSGKKGDATGSAGDTFQGSGDANSNEPEVVTTIDPACVRDQVCASETDCEPGERCNTTLSPPTCQKLYCSEQNGRCDPAIGDVLCAEGLTCIAGDEAYCCKVDCAGRSCGSDGCGGSCGTCTGGGVCTEAGTCECTPKCEGSSCGDDGCGGVCGTCEEGFACDAGKCLCSSVESCGGYNVIEIQDDPENPTLTPCDIEDLKSPGADIDAALLNFEHYLTGCTLVPGVGCESTSANPKDAEGPPNSGGKEATNEYVALNGGTLRCQWSGGHGVKEGDIFTVYEVRSLGASYEGY